MNKKPNDRILGMTRTEILVLVLMGGLVLVILLFGVYIIYDSNRSNFVAVLPPTSTLPASTLPVKPSNTPIPQPTPTIQITLLPGPARRYVPVTNEGMPANYEGQIIDEYRLADGDYYQTKFEAVNGAIVDVGKPPYFFSAFVGNTVDDAIKKYKETSQAYQVDSSSLKYDWSNSTYNSSLFIEAGQYIGHSSDGVAGEVGRVLRVNNVMVLITITIYNANGITSSDVNRVQQVLDKLTKIVEQKFR
jgi:hypothetical protein